MMYLRISVLLIFLCPWQAMAAERHEDKVVYVYNWSDYIDEAILEAFTRETGIEVVYDVFDSNDILETKLLAGNSGYDIVVPSGDFLKRQIQAGVFQKLDTSQLTNYGNLWDSVLQRTRSFDPDNAYSVNYMWGTNGIGYNVAEVNQRLPNVPLDSWALLFDPDNLSQLVACGVYILDAADEILPVALRYLGLDPTTTDANELLKAEPLLQSIRPYITKFDSSEYINALANGDICLAYGWSGDILQARDRADEADNGIEIAYLVPNEGTLMWFDQMAIPKDAPHPRNAHTFINYLLRAEVMAQATNYVYYANGNLASQAFIEAEILQDPAIYPPQNVVNNMFTAPGYSLQTTRSITRMWTRLKNSR